MSRRIVALLPMKVNTERVRGKNLRILNGKPLYRWMLDCLLGVEVIDQVIINTDAKEILAENGLNSSDRVLIRDRRPEICGEMVSMNLVLANDVPSVSADIYVVTHTSNPLLSGHTVRAALTAFLESGGEVDSLFTVNRFQTRFYWQITIQLFTIRNLLYVPRTWNPGMSRLLICILLPMSPLQVLMPESV